MRFHTAIASTLSPGSSRGNAAAVMSRYGTYCGSTALLDSCSSGCVFQASAPSGISGERMISTPLIHTAYPSS